MAAHSDIWPEDETESETDDDSWFYASVKRYKNLHMFDLQQATRNIEWIGNGSICVAGFDNPNRNEILELSVPETLSSPSTDEVLPKSRDFKMCGGGFTNRPIWNLKHIPNTPKIVTSEGNHNAIHVYQLGRDKSDIIEHEAEIVNLGLHSKCDTPVLDVNVNSQEVVFGTRLNDICLADIQTGKVHTSFISEDKNDSPVICQLCLISNNVVVACVKETGQIFMVDVRESQAKISDSSQPTLVETNSNAMTWTCAVANREWGPTNGNGSESGQVIGCLSSMGNFISLDIRKLKEASTSASLPHKMAKDGSDCFLNLQFAPHNPGIISVSGYDGNVCLYDITPLLHNGPVVRGNLACVSPHFVHDGHAAGKKAPVPGMLVMTHCWHPMLPNIVLSAGTDKSLHAWEWQVEPE